MTNEELLRERVAKLEVQMAHLSEKLDDTYPAETGGNLSSDIVFTNTDDRSGRAGR
jgi:hypothetical protein